MRLTYSEIRTLILVREYIKSNESHPIHLKDLADLFDMPRWKLHRSFKHYFNHTVPKFCLMHSMFYAKSLLDDDHNVKEVAAVLKYSDPANFRRAFKRIFGYYPNSE